MDADGPCDAVKYPGRMKWIRTVFRIMQKNWNRKLIQRLKWCMTKVAI